MLKRKLIVTGFLGFLLLLVTPNLNVVKGEPVDPSLHHPFQFLTADTSIVQTVTDSSFAYAPVEATPRLEKLAPRITMHRQAEKFMKDFLRHESEMLAKVKERSPSYFRIIDNIFRQYGIPEQMRYLAVVESYLRTDAVSRVGAKGMWQFMPQTARDLGLKITKKYDERTHCYKSTVAAAKYLKDLYREFGDWLLVLAAYNGGPGTVYKAIHRSGSRNFWALQNFLPAESRAHVKRFIGTHYYFEGEGSMTTMTKSETIAYNKALAAFEAQQAENENEDPETLPGVLAVGAVAIADKK